MYRWVGRGSRGIVEDRKEAHRVEGDFGPEGGDRVNASELGDGAEDINALNECVGLATGTDDAGSADDEGHTNAALVHRALGMHVGGLGDDLLGSVVPDEYDGGV